MKKNVLAALSIAVVLLAGCKKDDTETPSSAVTKANLLGAYNLVSIYEKVGSGPEQDMTTSYWEPCKRDNIISLKADDTYTETDAGSKCNPPDDDSGTWSLPSATSIVIDGETLTILSFDGKKLRFSSSETYGGTTIVTTVTISK